MHGTNHNQTKAFKQINQINQTKLLIIDKLATLAFVRTLNRK